MGALPKPMDIEAFLAWEAKQELRHEFDGIAAKAMTGGTGAHAAIERNLIFSLTGRLDGKPCQPYGGNLKLKLEHSIRYPDASVVCIPVGPEDTFTTAPVVVFEILSKSTARQDLGIKNAEYQATPSIQRYVILHQTHRAAQVFYRTEDDEIGNWAYDDLSDGDVLDMPEIGISIPLVEIYKNVTLAGRGLKSY